MLPNRVMMGPGSLIRVRRARALHIHRSASIRMATNLTSDSRNLFEGVDVASNVIKFPFGVSRTAHARKRRAMPATEIIHNDRPKAGSATAGNGRLRKERKEVWRMAEAATRYWRTRLDFEAAVSWAQRMGTPEGRPIPLSMKATECRWSEGTASSGSGKSGLRVIILEAV
jgi:hypothetical protein